MNEQKNHFVFEVGDKTKIIGKVLTYMHKRKRGKIFYEEDLYSEPDLMTITDAFEDALEKGDSVRAYFMNGELSKGYLITKDERKSIPTNEYYAKFHPTGHWTYKEAMGSSIYGEI